MRVLKYPIFIALIFFSTFAYAEYDRWVLSGTNISFDSNIFLVNVNSKWDKATIEFDDQILLAENGSCDANLLYRFCFFGARWDQFKNYGEFDPVTEVKTPDLHVTIEDIKPTVTITRSIENSKLLVNQETTVSVIIVAEGEKKIEELRYSELVPYSFSITELKGVTKKGNLIKWEYPGLIGQEQEFSYKFKVIKTANTSWTGKLYYVFDGKPFTINSKSISVKSNVAPNPLKSVLFLSKTSGKIGDAVNLNLELTNSDESLVQIHDLEIVLPKRVEVLKYGDDMNLIGNKISWSGILEGGESKELFAKLKLDYIGRYVINTTITDEFYNDIEEKYHNETESLSEKIDISVGKITPSISFLMNRKSLQSGNKTNIKVYLENMDDDKGFFDLSFSVKSDLFGNFTDDFEIYGAGQKELVFFKEINAPALYEDTTFPVVVSGKYRTQYYEYLDFEIEDSIVVKKDPDAIPLENVSTVNDQDEIVTEVIEEESTKEQPEPKIIEYSQKQVKKQGFISRFISAISRLLKDIFSS